MCRRRVTDRHYPWPEGRVFEKPHCDVLKAVRALELPNEIRLGNFSESSYINSQNKEQPEYLMTRDGFTLLAMGFTGSKAMQWKIKYIEAFNRMEQLISENRDMAIAETNDVDYQTAKILIDTARTFRDVMSKKMRRNVMSQIIQLTGAEITDDRETCVSDCDLSIEGLVTQFIEERCSTNTAYTCTREHFYSCFAAWCIDSQIPFRAEPRQ